MLLDTSALIKMFTDEESARQVEVELGDDEAYVSLVQLAELAGWALRSGKPVRDRIEVVKDLAVVLPLEEQVCVEAAAIRQAMKARGRRNFGIIDGILLATARSREQRLLTFDEDFEGEEDCIILK